MTATGPGTATITLLVRQDKDGDGSYETSVSDTITVNASVPSGQTEDYSLLPAVITTYVGGQNLIFEVTPKKAIDPVAGGGVWWSSNTNVATVTATTPSSGGRYRGSAKALAAGEATIYYTAGQKFGRGIVRVTAASNVASPAQGYSSEMPAALSSSVGVSEIRDQEDSGSPTTPEKPESAEASDSPANQADSQDDESSPAGEFYYPGAVTLYEYPAESFVPAEVGLTVVGEPKIFEITYDQSNRVEGGQAAAEVEISLNSSVAEISDFDSFFERYGVFKQIGDNVFDIVQIAKDADIPLEEVFTLREEAAGGGAVVGVSLCVVDSDVADVSVVNANGRLRIFVFDGKYDGKWTDPIFIAQRSEQFADAAVPPNGETPGDTRSGEGSGCASAPAGFALFAMAAAITAWKRRSR
jgi:hypothetical protein